MKLLTILGARPQFIKAGAVSREILKRGITEVIVHTGQHFDYNMSQVFFDEMDIPLPNYNLNIHGLPHGAMTGRMLEEIEKVLIAEKPDMVIVYGDTNSTLAGALAAQKLSVPVAHIEAGLRSFNMSMPEETNRIITDRISSLLFCPTETAVNNLKAEGFEQFNARIINSGDVMLDAALFYGKRAATKSTIIKELCFEKGFLLGTIHRQENTDNLERLKGIVEAFNRLSQEISVVVPLHPRTRKIINDLNIKTKFLIIEPVGYLDMIELLKYCSLVLTDSGGLQKEAFFFKKGCVTLRDETEWVELVNGGFNLLAGAEANRIVESAAAMMNTSPNYSVNLYGNGNASANIVEEIMVALR
jgi:UDP-GlcNAc3NAcA epimerase